ncbi:MAG: hypothetical protein FJ146_03155 [Deltaproteobacteria bacterium]|nr:hypothetical protein [Deltaproteobacteria bacterium]
MKLLRLSALFLLLTLLPTPSAKAFWSSGSGHYGLRGSTETAPAFQKNTGTFQAIEQSFLLTGEARVNDQLSTFLELRLFEDLRRAYLGNVGQPADCAGRPGATVSEQCANQHQSTGEPGYRPYSPNITKAYVRYAFDYCILEAGRRGRQWGLGMLLDDGTRPFAQQISAFDGVTCNVNIQKSQTLGFSLGYDKLAETGSPVDPNWNNYPGQAAGTGNAPATAGRTFGAYDPYDDLDQYFFTIEYDDRKANAGATFTKQVGVYFAQILGKPYKTQYVMTDPNNPTTGSQLKEIGGDATDLKFLDLYTGFYLGDLALRNEVLFRMGKSMDPNWLYLGGSYGVAQPVTNNLDSVAVAGDFEWTIAHSGAPVGPIEFNKGDMTRHLVFFNYAYAPGNEEGYRTFDTAPTVAGLDPSVASKLTKSSRSNNVKAIQFHRNFKPALLLFNAQPNSDTLIVDGAFNPSRFVNATLFATGYRYESMENGNFEVKLLTANLNEGVPTEIQQYYTAIKDSAVDTGSRPAGFYGRSLGWELDLSYTFKFGRDAEIGASLATALPGKAWQTRTDTKPTTDFLLQSMAVFHF